MINKIKKYKNSNQDRVNQEFIENYQERIIIFKKILRDVCPDARTCSNGTKDCPRSFNQVLQFKHHLSFDLRHRDIFEKLFPWDEESYPDKNYNPEQWHTKIARVIYFLLKNKQKSNAGELAIKKFEITKESLYKIKHEYFNQQKDFLSTPSRAK
jgi:hypothetical protein